MDNPYIQLKFRTPDGTIIQSITRHDYVEHKDQNGKFYMVDGGILGEYIRCSANIQDCENLCVRYKDGHEKVRQVKFWGARGKDGKAKLRRVSVSEMSDDHLYNLLNDGRGHGSIISRAIFQDEVDYRKENNIYVAD